MQQGLHHRFYAGVILFGVAAAIYIDDGASEITAFIAVLATILILTGYATKES